LDNCFLLMSENIVSGKNFNHIKLKKYRSPHK
jgi:hypothetical protein